MCGSVLMKLGSNVPASGIEPKSRGWELSTLPVGHGPWPYFLINVIKSLVFVNSDLNLISPPSFEVLLRFVLDVTYMVM